MTFSDLFKSDISGVELIRTTVALLIYADQCDAYQHHVFSYLPNLSQRTRSIALIMIAYNLMNGHRYVNIDDESYDSVISFEELDIDSILQDLQESYNIHIEEPNIAGNLGLVAYMQIQGAEMTLKNVTAFLKICDGLDLLTQIYAGEDWANETDISLFPPSSFDPQNTELFMRCIRRYADERGEFVRDYYNEALKHVEDKEEYTKLYTEFMKQRAPFAIAYWAQKEPQLLLTTVIAYHKMTIPQLEQILKMRITANRRMLVVQAGSEPVNLETTVGDKWYMHANIYLMKSNDQVYALTSQEILHSNTNIYTMEPIYTHNLQATLALQTEWENILHLDIHCDPFCDD